MYYSERAIIAMAKRAWTCDFTLCPADHRIMALVTRLYRYRGIQVKFRYVGRVPEVPTRMTFYEIIKLRSSK